MKIKPLVFATAALAAAIHGPAPRYDAWRVIGPGGAGGMFLPTISPHDPNVVLEHCDMTGAYLSRDAGLSWRMFNLRGTVASFAFDPTDANVIYAGNHALWRSADAGKSWRMILPDPARSREQMRDDHAAVVIVSDDPVWPGGGRIRFIAVDPAGNQRIYVLTGNNWLLATADRGRTWSRVRQFPKETIRTLYFDGALRLVAETAVYTLRGNEWQQIANPADMQFISASGGRGRLYATSAAGIHISEDGGTTWRVVKDPLPGAPVFGKIACSANHPETAYASYVDTNADKSRSFGIARTSDAGQHWSTVYLEGRKPAANVERAWIEGFYGGTGPIVDLAVAPNHPDVCYATDHCPRAFRTVDGGKSWRQIISEHVEGDRWTTTGYDVTTCYGVHFDPFDHRNVFISYTDVGLFKSSDGTATWKSSIAGIPRRWQNTTYWVEFDPAVKGLMWGGFARTHDLPRPKMWQRHEPETFGGGVATSSDGGEHWTLTNSGMPETPITHIVIDPASPSGARVLYACGFGTGVWKSVDNGRTWSVKNAGIEKRQPFAWRITRAGDGTLYLIVARRIERGYNDAEDGALYRSTDGAEHWTKMKLPAEANGPNGLALDPRDQRRMYLATWGAQTPEGARGGGVYLSTDAGASWRNVFNASQHVYDVTVDPRQPDVLYNAGFESGAYRSLDRGATWSRIRGFNFKWGHRVIPDPDDAAKIFITTFGGSVWHGPAAGDPQAIEDIVP